MRLKGKVIALDFWATWCGPCRAAMPLMQDIYRDLKGEGFALLGVNQGEEPEKIQGFLKELNLDIPVALDRDGRVAAAYQTDNALPTLVLIGEFDVTFLEPSELMAREIPDNRHVVMRGLGHMTAIEAPKWTAHELLDFLACVGRTGRANW